jgi:hypothetical protein
MATFELVRENKWGEASVRVTPIEGDELHAKGVRAPMRVLLRWSAANIETRAASFFMDDRDADKPDDADLGVGLADRKLTALDEAKEAVALALAHGLFDQN